MPTSQITFSVGLLAVLHMAVIARAESVGELNEFQVHRIVFTGGEYQAEPFQYLVLPPQGGPVEGTKYPLILFLHGAGERGNDPQKLLPHFPTQMAKPEWREKFPCYVIVPQCRDDRKWVNARWEDQESTPLAAEPTGALQMSTAVLEESLRSLPVDPDRVYLTGLSMGGFGVWELAMRRPELFAALAPCCGGADEAQASRLKHLPIWTAHGDQDRVVWPIRSQRMVAAVKAAGGNIQYTEYKDVGHNSWAPFFGDPEGVVPWLFQQRRAGRTVEGP
jgi:predicted peptidase